MVENERNRLQKENEQLMALLKQVQDGLVVNDEVLGRRGALEPQRERLDERRRGATGHDVALSALPGIQLAQIPRKRGLGHGDAPLCEGIHQRLLARPVAVRDELDDEGAAVLDLGFSAHKK